MVLRQADCFHRLARVTPLQGGNHVKEENGVDYCDAVGVLQPGLTPTHPNSLI